jgi:hypothetical protein
MLVTKLRVRPFQKTFILIHQTRLIASANVVKSESTELKSYDDIPAPPGGGLPILGHTSAFVKKPAGFEKSWKNILELKSKFVPPDVQMLRLNVPLSNPEGKGKLLIIFDPGMSSSIQINHNNGL